MKKILIVLIILFSSLVISAQTVRIPLPKEILMNKCYEWFKYNNGSKLYKIGNHVKATINWDDAQGTYNIDYIFLIKDSLYIWEATKLCNVRKNVLSNRKNFVEKETKRIISDLNDYLIDYVERYNRKIIDDSMRKQTDRIIIKMKDSILKKEIEIKVRKRYEDSIKTVYNDSVRNAISIGLYMSKLYEDSVRKETNRYNIDCYNRQILRNTNAQLSSVILPGSGSIILDRNLKTGPIIMVGYIGCIAGAIYSYNQVSTFYGKYQNATTQLMMDNYYSQATQFQNLFTGFVITAGTLWLTDFMRVQIKSSIYKNRLKSKIN